MDKGESINDKSGSPEIPSTSKSCSSIQISSPNKDSAEEIKDHLNETPGKRRRSMIPILSYDPYEPSTSVLPVRTGLSDSAEEIKDHLNETPGKRRRSMIPILSYDPYEPSTSVLPVRTGLSDSAEEIKDQINETPGKRRRSMIPILLYDPLTPRTSVLPVRTGVSSQSFSGAKAHSKIPVLAKKTVAPVSNRSRSSVSNGSRLATTSEMRLAAVENGIRSSDTQRVLSRNNNLFQNYPPEKVVLKKPKTAPIDGRKECHSCHRLFVPDRLIVHEKICKRFKTKKRKTFDAAKHRVQGTDAESYLRHPPKRQAAKEIKKLSWRKQHEEFIIVICAAKEAQVYLAKGGKLSDLPPPPPSDTSHYTPCPHCGRKFNQTAAARHIYLNVPKWHTTSQNLRLLRRPRWYEITGELKNNNRIKNYNLLFSLIFSK